MADAFAGFSPRLAAALRSAGVTFDGKSRSSSSPGWGSFTQRDLDNQHLSQQIGRTTGEITHRVGAPSQAAVMGGLAFSKDDIEAEHTQVDKLYQQYQDALDRAAQEGQPIQKHRGWFTRAMDYISRPGQATEALILGDKGASKGQENHGNFFSDRFKGAGHALTGSAHYSYGNALYKSGVRNKWILGLGGLAGDIVLDPTSYAGIGVASHAVAAPAQAARTLDIATKFVGADKAAALSEKLGADIAAGTSVIPPRKLSAYAKAGTETIDQVSKEVGNAALLNARASLKAATNNPKALLGVDAARIMEEAPANASRQLTELLHANLDQQVQRSLKLSFAGKGLAELPLPMAAQHALAAAGKVDMVGRTLDAFDRAFHTGTRFDNALTVVKAREAGRAQRRIEVGRQLINQTFTGTDRAARRAFMEGLSTTGRSVGGHGLATNGAGEDVADAAHQMLSDLDQHIDFAGDGSKPLTVSDLNRYLPGKRGPDTRGNYYKFDKTTLPEVKAGTRDTLVKVKAAGLADLIKANGTYLRHVDPAKFLYALHIAVEKGVARDQLGQAIREWGIPANLSPEVPNPATGKTMPNTSAAKQLVDRHGYAPIYTKGHSQEASGFYAKHLEGLVFAPEVRKGLLRVIDIAEHAEKRGDILRTFDTVQGIIKKVLTLPTPAFHLRNSLGDVMVSAADGVFGPRGIASYQQAGRAMASLRRLRKSDDAGPMNDIMTAGVDPVTGQAPSAIEAMAQLLQATPEAPGAGKRIMRAPRDWPDAPGGYLTDAQLWAAYNHAGLNQGMVAGDLGMEQGVRGPIADALAPASQMMDKLTKASAARENFFRLAHFIDRLKRSKAPTLEKAAEEAAFFVRKFHFDYTDVTPFEQTVMARVMPFYKWQRFATPLMLQLFFAKPGVILNWQRAQAGLSATIGGYHNDDDMLPTADQILPEYFSDASMYPLYQSARGNNVYMNPGVPSTSVLTQTLGLGGGTPREVLGKIGGNLVSSTTPFIAAPYELATGRRTFGGGDIPTGGFAQYMATRFGGPVATLGAAKFSGKEDFDTRMFSALSGLGLSENTPKKQSAYLNQLLREIRANRKKAGIEPETTSGRPSRPSRGDR